MAASVPSTKSAPHPSTVGNSFVKQYYHLLAKNPETLHRFYKDDSKFTHGHGSQSEEFISGQKEINEKILSIGYSGAIVDLESGSVDCQTSLNGGVLVMVAGIITLKGQLPKSFVQTFFLAVQTAGYFVLNDVFRCLEKQPVIPVPVEPIVEEILPVAAATPEVVKQPVVTVPEKVISPKKKQNVISPKQQEQPKTVVTTAPAAPVVDSTPKSWASHLFSGSKPTTAVVPPVTTSTAAAAAPVVAPKSTKKKNGWGDEHPTTGNGTMETTSSSKERPRAAGVLFIRDVPSQAKEGDLRSLFQEFGKITAITVIPTRGYAFVDFDTASAMNAALTAGRQYTLFDKVLKVEERHTDRRDNSNRGGYSYRGRGGGGNTRGGANRGRRGGDKGGGRRGGRTATTTATPTATTRMDN